MVSLFLRNETIGKFGHDFSKMLYEISYMIKFSLMSILSDCNGMLACVPTHTEWTEVKICAAV